MAFWEAVTIAGLVATIMGAFLTIYGIFNNKTLKEESRNTREILDRIGRGQEEARKEMANAIDRLAQLIVQEGERTRHVITSKT